MRSRNGIPVCKSNIHKMLKNTFYYGLMFKSGGYHQGNHEPIISKDLFDSAQDVLNKKVHIKKEKHFFHLRGLFTCAKCGCMLTAVKKKGHDYYFCTNGKGGCSEHEHYLRSEKLDQSMISLLDKIAIDEELVEIVYEASKQQLKNNRSTDFQTKETLLKQLENIRKKQSILLDSFVSMTTPKEVYGSKMRDLGDEEISIKEQLGKLELEENRDEAILEKIKNVFLEASRSKTEYINGDSERRNSVANQLLWNLTIENQEVLNYQAKEPFHILFNGPKMDSVSCLQGRKDSNPQSLFWRQAVYR